MSVPKRDTPSLAPFSTRKAVLENEAVALWYYPELKIVHHQMMQAPSSEQFRELLSEGAKLVEFFAAPKWLSDDRGNIVLRDFDEEWAEREWLPRVLVGGLKFWAIVLPMAAIGKLNMRRLAADHARRGIVSRFEDTPEAGFKWLKEQ